MPTTDPGPYSGPLPYRIDPLTGQVAYLVPDRQHRPVTLAEAAPVPGACPFCPGGLEAPEPYAVRWFANRWPAIPDGRSEVVLYSPDHEATFWSLGPGGARLVVDLWAGRSAELGARPDVTYVLPFENRGAEVGATITHPHGQIYAFDTVPPVPRAELDHGDVGAALGPGSAGADDTRLVARHGTWRAWVPAAAVSPFELVAAPADQVPDLPSLDDGGRDDLAALLVDVLARFDAVVAGPMPYLLWIHQRPFAPGPWPLRLAARARARSPARPATTRYVAAGEIGSGVYFNPVDPEKAAAALRAAGQERTG